MVEGAQLRSSVSLERCLMTGFAYSLEITKVVYAFHREPGGLGSRSV